MAHFVRPLALAEACAGLPYEVHFYAPARFSPYLKGKKFTPGELAAMPGEQFLENVAKGRPMYPREVLRQYVLDDRALIQRLRPDLVVGDMRLTLPIAARLEGVPAAVMMNAYWSPWAVKRCIVPELPLTRVIPPRILGPLYRAAEPLGYRMHTGQMNQVRLEFGLPPLAPDLRRMYTEGDHVLYADIPEFVPTPGAPSTHRHIGICEWTSPSAKPEWWDRMAADPKPKVWVTLGSSGPLRVMPALLRALSRLPVAVILSTSGRDVPAVTPGAFVAPLLPFTETAAVANVVVSHGGSGGLYPAMLAGTPVLGIPSNADQHLSTATLAANGAGLGVRVEEANEQKLHNALEKLLFEPQYKQEAQRWGSIFAKYDSGAMFRQFLSDVL